MSTMSVEAQTAAAPRRRAVDVITAAADLGPVEVTGTPAVARREQMFRHALGAADAAAALAAVLITIAVAGGALHATALLVAPCVVVLAKVLGLYDRDAQVLRSSTLDETPGVLQLALLLTLAVWFAEPVVTDSPLMRAEVATLLAATAGLLLGGRFLARQWARRVAPAERVLVIGDEATRARIASKLEADTHASATLVAGLPFAERRAGADGRPWETLDALVGRYGVHRVLIAPGDADAETAVTVISRAKALGVNVTVVPRIAEVIGSSVTFDSLGGIPMFGVRRFGLTRSSRLVKRAIDVVGATLALLVAAPVLAVLAVAIKLDSRGPVFFRHTRVGRGGRHFTMLKLRTMVDGADAQRAALRDAACLDGLFKMSDDPRVTRVGRFVRRMSLDELPQLINVLRGEMSLVGPRPLPLDEDGRIAGWHRRRLDLTPGMTGPWQVMGSAHVRVPLRDMVTIDYLYAASWSLWVDAQVLLRTIGHVVLRRGI